MAETLINVSMSFLTDIITSYDGHEQRFKLRQTPRSTYSFTYDAMTQYDAQWLRSIIRIPKTEQYYVPMWHRGFYLMEDYHAGSVFYIDDAFEYCMYGCDVLEVFVRDSPLPYGNPNLYRNIKRFGAGYVGFSKRIDRDLYAANTWVYPLRPCYVKTPATLDYVFSEGAATAISFVDTGEKPSINLPMNYVMYYQKHEHFNSFKMPETYNEKDVCLLTPRWVQDADIHLSVDKLFNTLDTQTGLFQYDLRNAKSYDTHTMELYLMSIEEINNLYRFFYRVFGRYKSFYCPTWASDVEVAMPITAKERAIYTEMPLYDFYKNNTRRKHLIVFTKKWKSYIFKIEEMTTEEITEKTYNKLVLSGDLFEDIAVRDILMVSFFNLVRLDNDELSIGFESNTVASSTLVMKEVDDIE